MSGDRHADSRGIFTRGSSVASDVTGLAALSSLAGFLPFCRPKG